MRKKSVGTQKIETRLLRALQANCNRSNAELAREGGINVSTVVRQKARFEKERIVSQYKAILEPEKFGFSALAFIQIVLQRNDKKSVKATAEHLLSRPGIQEIHIVAGPFDMLIKARATSNSHLKEQVLDYLTPQNNIKEMHSMIVLWTYKETMDLPI